MLPLFFSRRDRRGRRAKRFQESGPRIQVPGVRINLSNNNNNLQGLQSEISTIFKNERRMGGELLDYFTSPWKRRGGFLGSPVPPSKNLSGKEKFPLTGLSTLLSCISSKFRHCESCNNFHSISGLLAESGESARDDSLPVSCLELARKNSKKIIFRQYCCRIHN